MPRALVIATVASITFFALNMLTRGWFWKVLWVLPRAVWLVLFGPKKY